MEKYLPTAIANTVYDIDFVTLYEKGKKVILFDLDNTLATYQELTPNDKTIALGQKLKAIGFQIYIISNNHEKRIKKFTTTFSVDGYLTVAHKPFIKRLDKYLKINKLAKKEIVMIGDQLVTDIACANKLGVDNILVASLSRDTEKWYTKLNRLREKRIVKKIIKVGFPMAEELETILLNKKLLNNNKKANDE